MTRLSLYLILFSVFMGCSLPVIDRQSSGQRPRVAPRKFFNGVKKKVALLTFFNESP
ncbi:MAG: hypothetical protein NXH75_00965 [Halobacteriovoraceae bacterium]|nr:hypothetical protein [Halobacteriovoraceae bacterium]